MIKTLDAKLLIEHGTYSAEDIENVQRISLCIARGESDKLSFEDKLKFVNFLFLTSTYFDGHFSIQFVYDAMRNIDKDCCKIIDAIRGDDSSISDFVGYKYPCQGSLNPDALGALFSLKKSHKYVDVGCGWGDNGIDVVKKIGCETYFVDPNAYNVRAVYEKMYREGLFGNAKIKVLLAKIQQANLGESSFDRAYLASTLGLSSSECALQIIRGTLRLMKKGGIAAISGYTMPQVKLEKVSEDCVFEENYSKCNGFPVRTMCRIK